MARHLTRSNTEYLQVNSTPVTAAPFTISCWAKTDVSTTTDDYCLVQIQDKDVSNQYWRLNADGSNESGEFSFAGGAGGGFRQASSTIVPDVGVWYHVVGIEYASNSRACYVNGGNPGTNAEIAAPTNADSVAIGMERDSSSDDPWDGAIAEVSLWNTTLTIAEIRLSASGCPAVFIRPQNLVGYWPLISAEDFDWFRRYDMTAFNTPGVAHHPPVVMEYWNRIRQRAVTVQSIQALVSQGRPNVWSMQPDISKRVFVTHT
jgi:hypothetical protein